MAAPESGPGRRNRPRTSSHGRSLITFTALALAGLGLLLMTVAFLWPPQDRQVDLGHIDRFAPGTVTSFRIVEGRAYRLEDVPHDRVQLRSGVHVVRLHDGEVRAFSWRCTRLGWAVAWLPEPDGIPDASPDEGIFRSRQCGSTWSMDGHVIFGPAPRGLDGFEVTVTDRGRVVIDLGRVIEGERRSRSTGDATPAPSATPTPAPRQ